MDLVLLQHLENVTKLLVIVRTVEKLLKLLNVLKIISIMEYAIEKQKKTTILKILTISVILYFTTSKKGWDKISDGQLLETPCGTNDGWHAVLIEGYDLDKDCLICKNSWAISGKDRFDLKIQALKDYGFIEVYFTLKSIREIGIGEFTPKIKKFRIIKNWQIINCAWMDEITAIYSTEYICEYHKEQKGELKYKGVYIKDWINLNLNRD